MAALLAAVKFIAKQMATPIAAKSPGAKKIPLLFVPKVITPIPMSAPKIVKIILLVIGSDKNIQLIIAANIGEVLIMKRALAIEVNSIETTNSKVPKE